MTENKRLNIKTISQLFKFYSSSGDKITTSSNINHSSINNNSLKKVLLEWSSKSSAHGFPGLSSKNSNYIIRIVWIILMLTSWSYCFYTIIKTLIKFFEYGCDTNIDYINETPFPFPAIDICNLSPTGFNLLSPEVEDIWLRNLNYVNQNADYQLYQQIIQNLEGIYGNRNELEKHHEAIADALRFYEYFYDENKELFDKIPHNLSLILFNCSFRNKKCTVNDFKKYRNYFYGNCFRFNWDLNDLKMVNRPGLKYGLRLELFTGFDGLNTDSDGFKILINNQSFQGYPEENGFDISPGFQTNIAISRTFIKNLDWPYNQCLDNLINSKYSYLIKNNEILQKMISNGQVDHDENLCFKLCYQKYITGSCSCYDLSQPQYYYKSFNGCYYLPDKYCSIISDMNFFQTKAAEECVKKCPDRCTKFVYDSTISFSKYPSEWYLNNYVNDSLMKGNYSKFFSLVNIYFNEMPYKMVHQKETIDLESLLGYIGGQLGIILIS